MEPNQQRAFNFFFQTDLTQQQIADLLDVNRRTLHRWMKEGGWKRAKYAASHAPSVLIEQYYEQLGQMNLKIAARTEQPYPTKEESETIRRITATIKQMRSGHATCAESVEVFMGFTEKLRKKDMALLADVLPHITQYIKSLAQDGRFLNYAHYRFEEDTFDKEYEQWCTQNPLSAEAMTKEGAKEDGDPQNGEDPSPTPEPLPPTPPSGGGSQGDVTPPFRAGVETRDDDTQIASGKLPACEGGDDQKASASLIRGGGTPAGQVTQNGTSNGTSATPENNPKPATGITPAQNDNTELSTKNIASQCNIPAPKPAGRKVMSRSVEFRYTPKDRIF